VRFAGATVFGNQDAIAQRILASARFQRASRHTVEPAAAAPAGESDASVTMRPPLNLSSM
jgi:hypothetical protein